MEIKTTGDICSHLADLGTYHSIMELKTYIKEKWVAVADMKEFVKKEMAYCGISDEHIKNVLKQLEEKEQ